MALNIDLNYPPPGEDLFSLEAKYGINFLRLIGEADYGVLHNQQIHTQRAVSVNDIMQPGPSAGTKRTRLTSIKRIARSRNSYDEHEYVDLDEVPKKAEEPKPPPTFCCPICLETMQEETTTKCGHIFCKSCLLTAIKAQGKCPKCRKKIKRTDTFRVYLPDLK